MNAGYHKGGPGREDQLGYYASEDPIDRRDPTHDPYQEDFEGSSDSHDDERDDRHGFSREARDERRDHHGSGHGDRKERRHRRSCGRRFFRQMMEGMWELRDSIRGTRDSARPAHPPTRFEARLPQPQSQVPSRERAIALKEFRKLNPPIFNGEGGPKAAKEWMICISQFLDTLGIIDGGQRVSLTIF